MRGSNPSTFRSSQRVTLAHGAHAPARSARHNGSQTPTGPQPQRVPPVTTGHKFPRGASPSAFRPSQRVTHAHGAPTSGDSARLDRSNMPTGPQPQGALLGTASQNAHGAFASVDPARHNGSHMPTRPQLQRVPPVTTGHRCPRGPGPGLATCRLADLPSRLPDLPTCRPGGLPTCQGGFAAGWILH